MHCILEMTYEDDFNSIKFTIEIQLVGMISWLDLISGYMRS